MTFEITTRLIWHREVIKTWSTRTICLQNILNPSLDILIKNDWHYANNNLYLMDYRLVNKYSNIILCLALHPTTCVPDASDLKNLTEGSNCEVCRCHKITKSKNQIYTVDGDNRGNQNNCYVFPLLMQIILMSISSDLHAVSHVLQTQSFSLLASAHLAYLKLEIILVRNLESPGKRCNSKWKLASDIRRKVWHQKYPLAIWGNMLTWICYSFLSGRSGERRKKRQKWKNNETWDNSLWHA